MKTQHVLQFSLIVTILFILASTYSVLAQNETGVKGGIHFSDILVPDNNTNVDIKKRDGILAGIYYKKEHIAGNFGLQTELLYQQKGANYFIEKYDSPEFDSFEDYTFLLNSPKSYYREDEVLHYISVPVLVTFPASDLIEFYIGPEFGYLVSSSTNRQKTGELNRFSAGASAGAIINFCKHTSIDLRYSRDLSTFDKFSVPSLDMKNHGFSITLQQAIFRKQK